MERGFREKLRSDVFGKIRIATIPLSDQRDDPAGVTIGRNCIVGAESVVTKSVPDNTSCGKSA
jgi:hypothetical protein